MRVFESSTKMIIDQPILLAIACLLAVFGPCSIDAEKWGYSGNTAPEFWATLPGGQLCDGDSQSPINIDTNRLEEKELTRWRMDGFDELTKPGTKILNNGHTVQITLEGSFKIGGAGLPSTYSAVQLHFHWGLNNNAGSEHTRNGAAYPVEVHIVHYDSEKYSDILSAVAEPGGLAVLGFWIEVGEVNPAFNQIIDAFQNVKYKGQEFTFTNQLRLIDMLPVNMEQFYRYNGSLTTPGCYESVIWTVFEHPITMSQAQLEILRYTPQHVTLEEGGAISDPIGNNYRPVQDINGRTVQLAKANKSSACTVNLNRLSIILLSSVCFLKTLFYV